MFEFLGFVFVVLIIFIVSSSDEITFKVIIDGKEWISYEKKDTTKKEDKKNKKDLK